MHTIWIGLSWTHSCICGPLVVGDLAPLAGCSLGPCVCMCVREWSRDRATCLVFRQTGPGFLTWWQKGGQPQGSGIFLVCLPEVCCCFSGHSKLCGWALQEGLFQGGGNIPSFTVNVLFSPPLFFPPNYFLFWWNTHNTECTILTILKCTVEWH